MSSQSKLTPDSSFLSQFKFVEITDPNHNLPFDPLNKFQAYKQRLRAFENGVCYVLKQQAALAKTDKERRALEDRYKASQDFVKAKYIEIHKIEHCGSGIAEKVLFIEMERFTTGLAKVSGLSKKNIALGECFWVWQEYERPEQYQTPRYTCGQLILMETETSLHSPLTQAQKDDLFSIKDEDPAKHPAWFKKMPSWSQHALKQIVPEDKEGDWSRYLKTIPTTLRHLPGQANTTKHSFELSLTATNQSVYSSETYRQAVPTAYNMPMAFHEGSALNNVQQLLDDIASPAERAKRFREYWNLNDARMAIPEPPIVHIGLLSSRKQGNWLQKLVDFPIPFFLPLGIMGKENSSAFVAHKAKGVALYKGNQEHVFNINVPINSNRPKTAELVDQDFLNYAKAFQKKLSQYPGEDEKKALLAALIEELKNHDTVPEAKGRNKNMYLAALYDLCTRAMGGTSIINCKSSKDRTGLTMLMADAMLAYFYLHQSFPKSHAGAKGPEKEKGERNIFIEIFSLMYRRGHQSVIAGFNSPGSWGTKDEHMLDDDLVKGLGADYKTSKELASLNKPKTNFDKFKKKIQILTAILCVMASLITLGLLASGVLAPAAFLSVGLASYLISTLPVSVPMILAAMVPTLGSIVSGTLLYLGVERWMNRAKRTLTFKAQGLLEASKDSPPPGSIGADIARRGSRLPTISLAEEKPAEGSQLTEFASPLEGEGLGMSQ